MRKEPDREPHFFIANNPWLLERDELIMRNRQRRKDGYYGKLGIYGQRLDLAHKVNVNEVLKYARVARRHPNVWRVVTDIAERARENQKTQITALERNFLNFFMDWYLWKHEIPITSSPFMQATGLLLKVANGIIPDIESKEAKSFLLEDSNIFE